MSRANLACRLSSFRTYPRLSRPPISRDKAPKLYSIELRPQALRSTTARYRGRNITRWLQIFMSRGRKFMPKPPKH